MGVLAPLCQPDDLYDYRRWEDPPPPWLPHNQGDVFLDVDIAGVEGPQTVLLFMHPCTLRRGAVLTPFITVIPVTQKSGTKTLPPEYWDQQYKVMPLPELIEKPSTHAADFMRLSTISSEQIADRTKRIASLTAHGRQLFRQRIIYHLTRFAPSLEELEEATAAVDEETSLLGFWCEQACAYRGDSPEAIADAEQAFDRFMSEDKRRSRLAEIRERHVVATEVHKEMRLRYPIAPAT